MALAMGVCQLGYEIFRNRWILLVYLVNTEPFGRELEDILNRDAGTSYNRFSAARLGIGDNYVLVGQTRMHHPESPAAAT